MATLQLIGLLCKKRSDTNTPLVKLIKYTSGKLKFGSSGFLLFVIKRMIPRRTILSLSVST
jgi:hypothetical protein